MTFADAIEVLHRYLENLAQLKVAVGQETMAEQANTLAAFFNQRIWPIVTRVQLPQGQAQWHSATTELHRHMRLLAVEMSFAQAAYHSYTQQQRLGQIEQRVEQLQGFTQVLIDLADGDRSQSVSDSSA